MGFFSNIWGRKGAKEKPVIQEGKAANPAPQPIQVSAPTPQRVYTPGPPLSREDGSLYAVLAAAVANTLEAEGVNPEGGFAIRSAKLIRDPEGTHMPASDPALLAIVSAAVARTLECEGIDPQKGFAIRSVKAVS